MVFGGRIMEGFNIWQSYTLLTVVDYGFLILGGFLFVKSLIDLFKNTFINHCTSDNMGKNIGMFLSAVISIYFTGSVAVASMGNTYLIEALSRAGDKVVDVPYREYLLDQVKGNFKSIIIGLIIGGACFFFYRWIVKAIKRELEEKRKNVVHKRLYK